MNDYMDDPDIARETRRREACEAALERSDEMVPSGRNIGLLHDLVNEVHDLDPEDETGNMRMWPSETAIRDAGDGLTADEIAEKIRMGGWDPAEDRFMRISEDGDWEGFDTQIERIEMLPPDPWKDIDIDGLSPKGPVSDPFDPSSTYARPDPWEDAGLLPDPDPMAFPDTGADPAGGLSM